MTCYSKLSAACGLRRGNENPSVLEIKHNNVDKVIAALLSGGETGSGNPEWTANVSKKAPVSVLAKKNQHNHNFLLVKDFRRVVEISA